MGSELSYLDRIGHVFRAYDIRGAADTELTEDFAYNLGIGFASHLKETQRHASSVALGMDNRPSSPSLHAAVRDGLMSQGLIVRDLGLASTPQVGFAVWYYLLDGGICVTGSHNSPSNNGFKLEGRGAYPLAGTDISRLKDRMSMAASQESTSGRITPMDICDPYLRTLSALVSLDRPLTVVIDAGNGVMSDVAPRLFRLLGCEVVELFCELDSTFPNHIPNPEDPANMRDLQRAVRESGANVGFAFDGDGDRLGVVDETGSIFGPELTLMLLARDLLIRHHGTPVLLDVKSSRTAIEDIAANGGVPILTPTGHSLIRRRMADEGILLAGEHSGHFFCAEDYCVTSDALLAAARLAGVVASSTTPLSHILGTPPERYSSGFLELPTPEASKLGLVEIVTESLSRDYVTNTIDGVRVELKDGWALVRASNTGARLTLRFEANDENRLREIQTMVLSHLANAEKRLGLRAPDSDPMST
jgi:phosphomannomutase/phosphoglucomutase